MKFLLKSLIILSFTLAACQKPESVSVLDLLNEAKTSQSIQGDNYFVAISWKEEGGTILLEEMQQVFSELGKLYGAASDRSAFSPNHYKGTGDGSDVSGSGSMIIIWATESKNPDAIAEILKAVEKQAQTTGQDSAVVAIDSRIKNESEQDSGGNG